MKVFMLIITEVGAEEDVLKKLRNIQEIEESHIVTGPYDIVIGFTINNENDISKFRNEKIRRIPGVRSTLTLHTL